MPRRTYKLLRGVIALLVLLGLTTAILRSIAVGDLFARMEPVRGQIWDALGVTEPAPVRRAAFIAKADGKFAAHPTTTLLHILTSAGFLALVPLQLTRRVRTRNPRSHRISGRVAIVLAFASGLSGLFFGLIKPLGGTAEQLIVIAAGLFLLVAVSVAFLHIRAGEVAEHREWMLRAIGAALGIPATRIAGVPLELTLAWIRTSFSSSRCGLDGVLRWRSRNGGYAARERRRGSLRRELTG